MTRRTRHSSAKRIWAVRTGSCIQIAVRPEATCSKQWREPVFSPCVDTGSPDIARAVVMMINEVFGGCEHGK